MNFHLEIGEFSGKFEKLDNKFNADQKFNEDKVVEEKEVEKSSKEYEEEIEKANEKEVGF